MAHTHALDLLRREKTKLDLLDRAQRRLGVREEDVRHFVDGCCEDQDSDFDGFDWASGGYESEGVEIDKALKLKGPATR